MLLDLAAPTLEARKWQRRLRLLNVNLDQYTYSWFDLPCSTCFKLRFDFPGDRWYRQTGHLYVGSISIGVLKQEYNHLAKLRQVKIDQPTSAELSVRYWSFICLETHSAYSDAWIREHCFISSWAPTLRRPWITQHLKLKQKDGSYSSRPTSSLLSNSDLVCMLDFDGVSHQWFSSFNGRVSDSCVGSSVQTSVMRQT